MAHLAGLSPTTLSFAGSGYPAVHGHGERQRRCQFLTLAFGRKADLHLVLSTLPVSPHVQARGWGACFRQASSFGKGYRRSALHFLPSISIAPLSRRLLRKRFKSGSSVLGR